jgi:hypothetical protein
MYRTLQHYSDAPLPHVIQNPQRIPLLDVQENIDSNLQPDALHPNRLGMELLASCISPEVDRLMTANSTQGLT